MNKHFLISLLIIAIIIAIPATSYATFLSSQSSFGGKVLSAQLPIANCIGLGTGPVVLLSNVESLGSPNGASGLYGGIPYYANAGFSSSFIKSLPKTGGWILGKASIIPSFSTCFFQSTTIPFPVRPTSMYGTS